MSIRYSPMLLIVLTGFLSICVKSDCVGIKWVNVNKLNERSKPFIGGKEGDLNVYHCRVTHEGNIVTGKAIIQGNYRSCWIADYGSEYEYLDFEVLTNPNGAILRYVSASSGQPIPEDSLIAGRHNNGNWIHMSRAAIDNNLVLGKVDNGYAYVPYFSGEKFVQDYDILTCTSNRAHLNEHEMRILNKCNFSIQVGIRADDFTPENGGFHLNAAERKTLWVPRGWTSGRIWAKTNCRSNNCCKTGDCGGCKLNCGGLTGTPDATLAEFDMDKLDGQDYYDVSLIDAFNIQITIEPTPGTFEISRFGNRKYDCQVAGCLHDMIVDCPAELRKVDSGKTVSCLSACMKFGSTDYCCNKTNSLGAPTNCASNKYSSYFKNRCPLAYSYAYDDEKSKFVCRGAPNRLTGYITTFCP